MHHFEDQPSRHKASCSLVNTGYPSFGRQLHVHSCSFIMKQLSNEKTWSGTELHEFHETVAQGTPRMTNDGGLCQAQRRFHKSEWEYQSTGEGCECHWLAWIKWLRVLFLGFWQGTSKFVLSIRIDHNHNNLSRALCIRVFVDSNRNVTGASCWCSMTLSDLFCLPGAGQRVFELLDLKPDICEAGSTWSTTSTGPLCWLSGVVAIVV